MDNKFRSQIEKRRLCICESSYKKQCKSKKMFLVYPVVLTLAAHVKTDLNHNEREKTSFSYTIN